MGETVGDDRTHAKRVLAAIEAVIEKRASRDQMAYSIDSRSLSRTPIADLMLLRDRYKTMVAMEDKKAAGVSLIGRLRVRFTD
ncbi:hypothetical protein [Sinobacterium caligoides]|uniref:hypothetical protein n=1 Tax=Sinobacterium caligoides TaxID=933926 RepID=UPI000F4B598E|nr:hypothetical protein [Sinobacterium caligoides]